jgi:hypothetical protein
LCNITARCFAGRLVILGDLGIGELQQVLAITPRTCLDDASDHLHDRQDVPSGRVRLRSAFDLGDSLVEWTCAKAPERRGSGHAGITHQAVAGNQLTAPRGKVAWAG